MRAMECANFSSCAGESAHEMQKNRLLLLLNDLEELRKCVLDLLFLDFLLPLYAFELLLECRLGNGHFLLGGFCLLRDYGKRNESMTVVLVVKALFARHLSAF